jgi:hypothetical protein
MTFKQTQPNRSGQPNPLFSMTAQDLARSATTDATPPSGLSIELRALWLAKADRWDEAHDLCQEVPGTAGAWIHAWLHRQEGDISNARYWYSRADKPAAPESRPLDEEWLEIAAALLR